MTTSISAPVVDADGHVLEPADTWLKYLEPSFRDRAIRIAQDERGFEVLLIDGQPLKTLRGQLGALGGIDMDAARLLTRGQITYAEGSPAGFGTNEAAWSGACGTNGVEVTTEQLSTNAGGQLASNRVNTVSFNVLVP